MTVTSEAAVDTAAVVKKKDPAVSPEGVDAELVGRLVEQARAAGQRLAYTYEIVGYVPGERLVMRTAHGPFPMGTTYAWRADGDDRTRMTLRNRGEPAGFSRLVGPFVA